MTWLIPIWVGIFYNIGVSIFHVAAIGQEWGPIRAWYFKDHNGLWLLVAVWVVILATATFLVMQP